MARQRYKPAPEVEKIARELIRDHHKHLFKRRVEFVFTEKAPKSGTKEIWGTARIVNGLAAFLANRETVEEFADEEAMNEDFFVIAISEPVWGILSERCRKALLDHELCHCWVEEKDDGGTSLKLVHHDLEEFGAVVQRWGVWRDDLDRFLIKADQGRQDSLFDQEDTGDSDERADAIIGALVAA
jgi:Putative phage metallopeptidase